MQRPARALCLYLASVMTLAPALHAQGAASMGGGVLADLAAIGSTSSPAHQAAAVTRSAGTQAGAAARALPTAQPPPDAAGTLLRTAARLAPGGVAGDVLKTAGQNPLLVQLANQRIDPNLGKEIVTLEKQINTLFKDVKAVEAAAKPVVDSAGKVLDKVSAIPDRVDNFKTQYGIPKDANLTEEAQGIGRYLRDRLGISPEQSAKVSNYLKGSPVFEQLKTPFQPANIMMAVGLTAGMNVLGQLQSGDGLDLGAAMGFVGDSSFWGGIVGSGVGYGIAASVATMLIPAGAGLFPVLAPIMAGLTGSLVGWEAGAGLTQGKSLGESLANLSPTTVLGQAAGSTVGLLVGANMGAMLGGVLGGMAGPLGAMAGAMILGRFGAQIGEAAKKLFTDGDASEINAALERAGVMLGKVQDAGDAISDIQIPSLPSAAFSGAGLTGKLRQEYDTTYEELRQALVDGDRARAALKVQYLSRLSASYQAKVGEGIQNLRK